MLKTEDPGPTEGAAFEARVRQAQQLLEDGRARDAAPLFAALAEERPQAAALWVLLARCHEALGDGPGELAACERAIAANPALGRVRLRAAGILADQGRVAEAAAHYQGVSDAQPEQPRPALRLARLYGQIGEDAREAAAWTRVLAAEPDNAEAHQRLAELHWRVRRLAEAAPHLKRVLEVLPGKTKLWRRLAQCCEAAGDVEGAQAAWRKILEQEPGDLEAAERLAKIGASAARARGRSSAASAARLAVFGNCQAYAMAQCLRALLPDAEIVATGWPEIGTEAEAERVLAGLGELHAMVLQPVSGPHLKPFEPKAIIRRPVRSVFYPAVHFTGFHPDALLAHRRPGLRSLMGDWHSALILAAYHLRLPSERATELFNAYVYGVLGYFDEYAKAEQFLAARGENIGWDLSKELAGWRELGAFVHIPNHPRIEVVMSLARRVCKTLKLPFDKRAAAPPDPFARLGDWPVYPEIGRRLGLDGKLSFVSPTQAGRAFDLESAIRWFYAAYDDAPSSSLQFNRVDEIVRILKAEGI